MEDSQFKGNTVMLRGEISYLGHVHNYLKEGKGLEINPARKVSFEGMFSEDKR